MQSAFAFGILNEGLIDLLGGGDLLAGKASATAASGGPVTGAAIAFGYSAMDLNDDAFDGLPDVARRARGNDDPELSFLRMGSGNDDVQGTAVANGQEDVGAFGLLFADAETAGGADHITGEATADGTATTDARGISVGVSDIDDDTLQNPDDSAALILGEVGRLITDGGNDVLTGNAHVVAVDIGDDIFFAGANGIVVDGGTEEQLLALLEANPGSTVEDIIDQLDTSTLRTGGGNDALIVNVTLDVTGGVQGGQGGDMDLEVIADGIENAGTIDLGGGDDLVMSTVTLTAKGAAKGLADALDNSSVGIITGLGLEVNGLTVFDMGAGNDHFESHVSSTVKGDLAAGDGLGNRGTFRAGPGDDTFNLNGTGTFTRDFVNPGDQEEAIGCGWENRNDVFLGSGNDTVVANGRATGNGDATFADGIESRALYNSGSGDDTFELTGTATTTAGAPSTNLTAAAGLLTEQFDAGTFITDGGRDSITGTGVANSTGVKNELTIAFGISQVSSDGFNAAEAGLLSTGGDDDTLKGFASAAGENNVDAFGLLFTDGRTDGGSDALTGGAKASSSNAATAVGIGVGIVGNSRIPNEAGELRTGAEADTLNAFAAAEGSPSAAFGIWVADNSELRTGDGNDVIDASAEVASRAIDVFGAGSIIMDGGNDRLLTDVDGANVDATSFGGGIDIRMGSGDDFVLGFGHASINGGSGSDELAFGFSLADFLSAGGVVAGSPPGPVTFTLGATVLNVVNVETITFSFP